MVFQIFLKNYSVVLYSVCCISVAVVTACDDREEVSVLICVLVRS